MRDQVTFGAGVGEEFRKLKGRIIEDPYELARLDPRASGIPIDENGRIHSFLLRERGLLSSGKAGKAYAILDHTGKVWYKMARSVKRKE